jgi:RNA polymerase sigma-70 factor (ECF subfamily)
MMIEGTDRFLVHRLLRGDEEAFSEFFNMSFGPLFRFALRRLDGDADTAEDIVQATLCRAVRKLGTWRGEAALLTWLMTICRHEIAESFERRMRIPPMTDLMDDTPEIRAALESLGSANAMRDAERSEIATAVQTVLDSLPAHYGDALEWKYIDGLSVAEIAERLAIGIKAAESMLTRARNAFRDGFTAAYGNWSGAAK